MTNIYWDMNQEFFRNKFLKGFTYASFLEQYSEVDRSRWQSVYDRVKLSDQQQDLLRNFKRKMNVLCLVNVKCGDCVRQCPIMQRISEASDVIDLRFLPREENADLSDRVRILGGQRVPVAIFLSEDYFECARFGDRTLSTYRKMAKEQLGPSCATGIVKDTDEELSTLVQEWIDIFERVQLMLRLSPMLRARYND